MNKYIFRILPLSLLLLAACGKEVANTPKDVAKAFLTALEERDSAKAVSLADANTAEFLSKFLFPNMKEATNREVEIMGERMIGDDDVRVGYEIKSKDAPTRDSLTLKKIEGKWRVVEHSKFQTMFSPETEVPELSDSSASLPDSLAGDSAKHDSAHTAH